MHITLIAAVAENRAIGLDNQLIYHIREDLRRFKSLTTGHTVLMGRRTFESLPKGALPNRRNIVVSRTVAHLDGCDTYPSLEEALRHCAPEEQVFVIGGQTVYEQTLPLAHRLCMTEIAATPPRADAFFPPYDGWVKEAEERQVKVFTGGTNINIKYINIRVGVFFTGKHCVFCGIHTANL